jgi:hypothetical protein
MEAKVDALMRMAGGDKADALIRGLNRHYLREHGHARPHGHEEELLKRAGLEIGRA